MKRLLLTAALTFATACGQTNEDDFRAGLPSSDMVKLNVPEEGSTQQGLRQDELEGETAGFYGLTRGATVVVNVSVVSVLGLVSSIVENPPTSIEGDVAIWGPHTGPLARNTWKLSVSRRDDGVYEYKLEGKAKTAGDDAYVTVLSGSHERSAEANGEGRFGSGEFTLDWDAAKTLPEHDHHVGTAKVRYSRASATAKATVDVDFSRVLDDAAQKVRDAKYTYEQTPGAGGSFQFSTTSNVGGGAALEDVSIKSRWQAEGAGRADAKISGGDFISEATASECWDANFQSRFLGLSWEPLNGWGSASVCVFASAEYASL